MCTTDPLAAYTIWNIHLCSLMMAGTFSESILPQRIAWVLANKVAAEIAAALSNFSVNFQTMNWSACAETASMLIWIMQHFFQFQLNNSQQISHNILLHKKCNLLVIPTSTFRFWAVLGMWAVTPFSSELIQHLSKVGLYICWLVMNLDLLCMLILLCGPSSS